MIPRLIAAVQAHRQRPAGVLAALIGATLVGVGLGVLERVRRDQLRIIAAGEQELAGVQSDIARAVLRRDQLAGDEPVGARKPYPGPDDVDPLHRGDAGAEASLRLVDGDGL